MKTASLIHAVSIGFLGALAIQSPAMATPTITEAFLANVKPNVQFLKTSSKIALAKISGAAKNAGHSAAMQAYAQGELTDAAKTEVALEDAQALRVAAIVPASGDDLATGRSIAVEPAVGLGQAANGRPAMGQTDLGGLSKLSGRAFLDAFWLKQLDALSQLRADYEDYVENGDDAALVAMATRQLPVIEHRLALLSKL